MLRSRSVSAGGSDFYQVILFLVSFFFSFLIVIMGGALVFSLGFLLVFLFFLIELRSMAYVVQIDSSTFPSPGASDLREEGKK